jgi:hypothetical protein
VQCRRIFWPDDQFPAVIATPNGQREWPRRQSPHGERDRGERQRSRGVTGTERRAREAALNQLLDDIDQRIYPQVAEAVDFDRLDAVQKDLVAELERLIGEGKLPPAPDPQSINARAASIIGTAIYLIPRDPRRNKHVLDDDCSLCRMLAEDMRVS